MEKITITAEIIVGRQIPEQAYDVIDRIRDCIETAIRNNAYVCINKIEYETEELKRPN